MTRVLLVWPFYPPEWGAASLRGAAYARTLREAGADVHVLTPDKDRDPRAGSPTRPEGVPVHEAPLFFDPADVLSWRAARKDVGALLDDLDPDLVVASTPPPTVGWQVAGPVADRGIPLAVDVRDLFTLFMRVSHGRKLRYRLADRLEARLYDAADLLLPTTPPMADLLVERYGAAREGMHLVRNGADLSQYPEPTPGGDLDLAFLGLFQPGRRGEDLLEAYRRILAERPGTTFAFVGWEENAYAGGLRHLWDEPPLDDALTLIPPVPPGEVPAVLDRVRLGAVTLPDDPAYRAQLPRKTYDYLAAGVPPVALGPEAGGDLEDVLSGGAGRYTRTVPAFVDAVLELLGDEEALAAAGEAARERARAYHLPDQVGDAWTRALRPLAAGDPPETNRGRDPEPPA